MLAYTPPPNPIIIPANIKNNSKHQQKFSLFLLYKRVKKNRMQTKKQQQQQKTPS